MNLKTSLTIIAVYVSASLLVFASDLVHLGRIEDIELAPMMVSLVLLIPLTLWYTQTRTQGAAPDSKVERRAVWPETIILFSLAMVVRVPFVLLMGMSFEKTPVIYLLALTVILIKKANLGSFGFKTRQLGLSLLTGLTYYLVFAFFMFAFLLVSVYLSTGHLLIVGYEPLPPMLVFPFMTFCVGVSEEGLFRGFIQTRLSLAYSKKQALWAQALLFGIWHFVWHIAPFDPIGMIIHVSSSLVFGLVFGRFFEFSGNLAPLILAHGLVDTVGYGAVINPQLDSMQISIQLSQALSFIVGIIGLALLTKRLAIKTRVKEVE
jgi:membrane protease YdiL (CAAX protease family)